MSDKTYSDIYVFQLFSFAQFLDATECMQVLSVWFYIQNFVMVKNLRVLFAAS